MTAIVSLDPAASDAYDALAAGYDVLTRDYAYDRWLPALERLAFEHGLAGKRLLDLACGTGQSFLPLRARGYEVTGCDISAGMLSLAQSKAPEVTLHRVDMRELPALGSFDLVTCLDDSLNYLLWEHELRDALSGIATNLAPDGVALWDLNTVAQYRGQFACDHVAADDHVFVGWRSASTNAETERGGLVEIELDVFALAESGTWRRSTSVHRQRHWPRETVERLSRDAGLRLLDVRGQRPGVVIEQDLDELVHTKALYVACARKEAG